MRRLLAAALLLSAAMTSATPAEARSGAVFIHGAGNRFLGDPAGARAYWGEDMLRASTLDFTVPYLVAHYDSTQYMWVGAGQVAGQIHDWMMANAIDDIVVNTHSFGGTVIRWILSNPGYDSRYPAIIGRIRWVNAVAAPHKGSEAANLAGSLSGSWLTGWMVSLVGANTDAHKNCRTDWMAYYNQYYLKGTTGRPALPRSVYTIAGTGLWNDFAHSEDYGLATLSGIAGMPGEDDGMVSQYSAQGVGYVWFTTAANHHHNRRNDYRRIGDALGSDFGFVLTGETPEKEPEAGASGGEYRAPSEAAPAQTSRAFVRTVALRGGHGSVELPVTEGSDLLVWTVAFDEGTGADRPARPVRATLQGPSGLTVAAQARRFPMDQALPGLALRGAHEALLLSSPAPGTYRLDLEAAHEGRTVVTVVAAQPTSPVRLTAWAGPLSQQPGTPVTVYAELSDGGAALPGSVVARLAGPDGLAGSPVALYDDGRHGDGAPGDGIYAATVNPRGPAGLWTVRLEAQGVDLAGRPFARTGTSGFIAEPGAARLLAETVAARVVVVGGERRLRVTGTADVGRAGRYRVDVIVAGEPDGEGTRARLASAEKPVVLRTGAQGLSMDLPLAEAESPALVEVRLVGLDEPGLAGRVTLALR